MKINSSNSKTFGIIDGNLFSVHKNIAEFNSSKVGRASSKQHGDNILEFLEYIASNVSFYYYDAEVSGEISSAQIIEGLQWMISQNVNCVVLSLSGKRYSEELEKWISAHINRIKIYACYNNLLNTFDYPAQYEGVVGVGTTDVMQHKDSDILYKSYNIIVMSPRIKYYQGNSYLAPYAMLKGN